MLLNCFFNEFPPQESVRRDHKMMRGWFDAFRENGKHLELREFSFNFRQVVQRCTHTATGRQSLPTRPPSSSTSSSSPSSLPLSSSSLVSGNRPLHFSPPSSSIHHYLQRSPRLIPLWFQAPEVHHLHQRHPLSLRRHRHPRWPAWVCLARC